MTEPDASRQALWSRLCRTTTVDVAVVGGGATGLGGALDAALRGFSVALFDSHDFAAGTSSRSTKLLHGGVRYLAQGNLSLVREALAERARLLRNAPHLAQPLPFVLPAYRWWECSAYGLGLRAYDVLAADARLGRTRSLSTIETQVALPGVRVNGLRGGVLYWDAQMDDARLALALARSAQRAGALVINHARVDAITAVAPGSPDGVRRVVQVTDTLQGHRASVRARVVVNATGVWVDAVRQPAAGLSNHPQSRLVAPSQGVHLVVDRSFMPARHALLVPKTRDGRVLFAVPWMGAVILGTTDTPRADVPREPAPFPNELAFLLEEASRVLSRPVTIRDVRSAWVGLRPLVAGRQAERPNETAAASREHLIVSDPGGLVTVTGGKWTTYRAMAEAVVDHCMDHDLLPRRPGGVTRDHRLVGAPPPDAWSVALHHAPGPHLYGADWPSVLACPGAGRSLGHGLTEGMVRFAARQEYACTVEDVLARRWRTLFLDAAAAAQMADAVGQVLEEETGLDPRCDAFKSLALSYQPT